MTVMVGVVTWIPMGGLGALTSSHFLLPFTNDLLDSFRRALLLQPPLLAATRLTAALMRYLLPAAHLLVMTRQPAGLARGSGSLPGSTCRTLGLEMGASSLLP